MAKPREIVWGDDLTDITLDEPPVDTPDVEAESPFKENAEDTDNESDSVRTDDGDAPRRRRRFEEKRPTRTYPRKPIGDLFSFGWGGVGTLLTETGIDPVVGRTMQFQAPLAGEALDNLVAGTFVDKLLQPLASKSDAGKQAFSILGLPLIMGLLERNPGNPMVYQLAYSTVKQNIKALIPVMEKQALEAKEDAEALAELNEFFEFPEGVKDPVAFVLMQLMGPMPEPPPPMEAEPVNADVG